MAERQAVGENGDMSVMCDMNVTAADEAPEAPPSGVIEQEKDVLHATRRQVATRKAAVVEALRVCEGQRQELQRAIDGSEIENFDAVECFHLCLPHKISVLTGAFPPRAIISLPADKAVGPPQNLGLDCRCCRFHGPPLRR